MPHKTPRSLNDNLRLARLTVPQWIAGGVGLLSLWVDAGLARHVANPNMHILAVALPTVVVVAPILALGRGGIEKYPAQALRFAWRRTLRYGVRVARATRAHALKGGIYATITYRQARRRQL